MSKLFYLATAAAFALVPFAVKAADLPPPILKAPPAAFAVGGMYMGMGTSAATDRSTISDPILGSAGTVTTVGAAIEGILGYHYGTAARFYDVEASVGYTNLGGVQTNIAGAGIADINSRVFARGTFKIGGTQTYTNLLGAIGQLGPNLGLNGVFTPPVIGPGALPYFALDVKASRLQTSLGGLDLAGNPVLLSNEGWQVRPGVGLGVYSAIMNTITGKPTGCMMDTSMHYYPAGKGITVGFDGTASLGREFEARLAMVC